MTHLYWNSSSRINLKDIQREKASSNKTPAIMKSMNIDICVVGISNQLCIAGSYIKTKFSKKRK